MSGINAATNCYKGFGQLPKWKVGFIYDLANPKKGFNLVPNRLNWVRI